MDWALAIDRNRIALTNIVAGLIAMAGGLARLPRSIHSGILAILRPAESAVRRLIVIVAYGMAPTPAKPRPGPRKPHGKRSPPNTFQLFDTRKRFGRVRYCKEENAPRVWSLDGYIGSQHIKPEIDPAISSMSLSRRLAAIKGALADLPRQARRLANWRARRAAMKEAKFRDPIRPGPPPGWRRKRTREVDELLWECVMLARDLEKPDTS